jgi:zinc-binding alcohol dehydrogenase/oxidoreductase
MKALVLNNNPDSFAIQEVVKPTPTASQVLVRVLTASLNHRDQWIRVGKYAKIQYPAILGSDACGIVEQVGTLVNTDWLGKRVIVNPNISWGKNQSAQAKNYSILGMPSQGTLAEYVVVDSDRIYTAPEHLTDVESASLPLAGLTAFRAVVSQGRCSEGMSVLITGIGGGVALFALKFAHVLGANVYVTSGDDSKIERAIDFGAKAGVNYRNELCWKELSAISNGIDLTIDGTGGAQMNSIMACMNPGGTIVSYGATLGSVPSFDMHKVFWKQLQLKGTTMGSDDDFKQMIDMINDYTIHPVIDSVIGFQDVVSAFDSMAEARQFGKLVIRIGSF